MSTFYSTFERHAKGEGIKGHSTHYCPGCGHGLAHKYLAEAIEELGIQDRTIAISPVGCSVFLYYYLDVGNSQAAHGRAPSVAIGHKMANPESIVISYQGDGDLASIGLAEIFQAAQLGVPISVIFINNAIYGMTGGQMAPTTLPGMKTMTSPSGRTDMMGAPLKMAELMAQIDAPVYVERVALYDSKQRIKAKKAIKKSLHLQVENKGFSFVEILAECPTHLHMSPTETEEWIKNTMTTYFPLGIKKDGISDFRYHYDKPIYDPKEILKIIGAEKEIKKPNKEKFPSHISPLDVAIKLAGAGGDGAQTAALLIAKMGIYEGFDATHLPSYGPESRGGTSYADVHIAEIEVLSSSAPKPNILIAFNQPSTDKFSKTVEKNGFIIVDSSVVHSVPKVDESITIISVPMTELANTIGKAMFKNVVALGALQAATQIFSSDSFIFTLKEALKDKPDWIEKNIEAFTKGVQSVVNRN